MYSFKDCPDNRVDLYVCHGSMQTMVDYGNTPCMISTYKFPTESTGQSCAIGEGAC